MKQSYKKLSAWMILVGLFLQTATPVVAAVQSSSLKKLDASISGESGVPVKISSSELEESESVDVAHFNVQVLIEQIVADAVEQGCENKLSPALMFCYKSVLEGKTVINVDTLIEAMPELLDYAVLQEKLRAIRPDAPVNSNNTIVACGGNCDLTQLIRLLASIRARIGTVEDNPCCGTILGILGDACNVPCIGENGSISEVLCEILDTLTECCSEIIDTITECCAEIIETITECCAEIHEDFEDTWTILADIKDTITECCAEIKSEIFDTQTLIIDEFEQTWTILEDCCACGPIPLFQSDVVSGVINLTITGLNYCLAENITATIFITGANVTVDGNDRVLTGRIYVDAEDVIVKNTKVKTPAPSDNTEAAFAGIHATSASLKIQIINCLVECADSIVGVNARAGIFSNADETVIERCNVTGGNGDSDGYGIFIQNNNGSIENSVATGSGVFGYGVRIIGNNGSIENSTGNGTGVNAPGTGFLINGNNGLIKNSIGVGVGQGSANGFGMFIIGNDGLIENSTGTGTALGNGTGYGIYILGNGLIEDSIGIGSHYGFFIQAPVVVILKSCSVAGNCAVAGIAIDPISQNIQICECKIDNVIGDGILVNSGAQCIQVVSNRVSCCQGTGINNGAGTEATFYNNIVTDCNPNYVNVPLIRVPGPQTGFFTNVTQGPQDCDLCDLFTVVEDCCACGPIPLFQSDAIGGVIALSTAGLNYCLAENITATIFITGANVTVDGNDRVLTGRVVIDAADVVFKNTKVKPEAAVDTGDAANPGIEITVNGINVQILSCLIECADSIAQSGFGLNGRSGIVSFADNTIIERCNVKGSNGGISSLVTGGNGGNGIGINGNNGLVKDSTVTAGNGGAGDAIGGNGGSGILITSDDWVIDNLIVTAGNGGTGVNLNGGSGGRGIEVASGNNGVINNSIATAGNGGDGSSNGGFGGNSISISGNTIIVKLCNIIEAGAGGNCTFGNPGNGGRGILVLDISQNIQICECKIDNVAAAGSGGLGGALPGSGIEIEGGAQCIQVVSNRISCCQGTGINNDAIGTEATFYNNIVTDCNPNYANVPLVRVPGPQTGFFTNVTQGEQDCDLCDLFTVVEDCCACGPIPLFQSDVIGGVINLTTTGLNYCLAENITATIFITGANVTVDGNDRVLTGRIYVDAEDVIVKNTKVKTPAADNNTEASFAGVFATSVSLKVQIINCLVECADSVVGVNARAGIFSNADETVVERCNVTGGDGLGNGFGIRINGNNGSIKNSTGTGTGTGAGTGIGIVGNNGSIENSTGTGTGALQGFGIEIIGDNGSIKNSTGTGTGTGTGVSSSAGIVIVGNNGSIENSMGTGTGTGVLSGIGILISGNNGSIENSMGTGTGALQGFGIEIFGDNGSIENSTGTGTGTGVSSEGIGIVISGNNGSIKNSTGTGTGVSSVGIGISIVSNNGSIENSTGTGTGALQGFGIQMIQCDTIIVKSCSVINVNGPTARGIYVDPFSQNIQINECKIDNVTGDGIYVDAGAQCVQVINNQILSSGGNGCFVNNAVGIQIEGCSATCNGLDGFRLTGTCFVLANLTAFKNTGTGINVVDVTNFQVKNCKVECNGGDGITIGAPCLDGQIISNCANSNGGIGINSFVPLLSLALAFGNNASTFNATGNYGTGVLNIPTPTAIMTAGPTYWTNVFFPLL